MPSAEDVVPAKITLGARDDTTTAEIVLTLARYAFASQTENHTSRSEPPELPDFPPPSFTTATIAAGLPWEAIVFKHLKGLVIGDSSIKLKSKSKGTVLCDSWLSWISKKHCESATVSFKSIFGDHKLASQIGLPTDPNCICGNDILASLLHYAGSVPFVIISWFPNDETNIAFSKVRTLAHQMCTAAQMYDKALFFLGGYASHWGLPTHYTTTPTALP